DFGGRQRGARRRYRCGVDRWRDDVETLRGGAWAALFESRKSALSRSGSRSRAQDERGHGVGGPETGAPQAALNCPVATRAGMKAGCKTAVENCSFEHVFQPCHFFSWRRTTKF